MRWNRRSSRGVECSPVTAGEVLRVAADVDLGGRPGAVLVLDVDGDADKTFGVPVTGSQRAISPFQNQYETPDVCVIR